MSIFKVNVIALPPSDLKKSTLPLGDMHLLGVRTLEGFGVMVDNIAHRFVATTTLAV
ncbi:MAG: hypothetical protein HYS08_03310 [Chlamydiae bacterium]|nr:hypothetical protein [Chlamydiota bacterium]